MIEEDGDVQAVVGLRRRRPLPQQLQPHPHPSTSRNDDDFSHRHSFPEDGEDDRHAEEEEPSPLNSSRLLSSPSSSTSRGRGGRDDVVATRRGGSTGVLHDHASEAARTQHPAGDTHPMQQGGAVRGQEPIPQEEEGVEPPRDISRPPRGRQQLQRPPRSPHRLARLYCMFSFGLALVAVITPSTLTTTTQSSSQVSNSVKKNGPNKGATMNLPAATSAQSTEGAVSSWLDFWPLSSVWDERSSADLKKHGNSNAASMPSDKQENSNWFLDFVSLFNPRQAPEPAPKEVTTASANPIWSSRPVKWLLSNLDGDSTARMKLYSSWLVQELVDPILLERPLSPTTLTDLLDKILTSTFRLLALANLLLSWTYILQTAVVDWFLLDPHPYQRGMMGTATNADADIGTDPADPVFLLNNPRHHHHHHQPHSQQQQHRLLGGFLVFKMLLVSAVIAPDTLDWMILLSWYTLLSFLRSLSRTCANVTERSGMLSGTQPPPSGVWQLLALVLVCDILAAAVCVALFHGAGWAMVILLTCDCALLGLEVITNLLEYVVQWLETQHIHQVHGLERNVEQERPAANDDWVPLNSGEDGSNQVPSPPPSPPPSPSPLRLDPASTQRLEVLERRHARRLQVLETTIFALQLMAQLLTCAHFVHIWSLHGVQFSLIDGVLALHLHSAITTAGKKIQERRNLRRIARDLDGMFATATPSELRKAAIAGDVCCICLCSMTVNVKKVACGHLYHTGCLREVVERARSIEAARCPLCRSSLLNGRRNQHSPSPPHVPDMRPGGVDGQGFVAQGPPLDPQQPLRVAGGNGERPLFRFSTEEVFPDWLPLPAFAFEVVRRPSANVGAPGAPLQQHALDPQPEVANAAAANDQRRNAEQPAERPSFLRQLMILAGALVPLTPEEEAGALDQLVDMFPQYDRADLLRALRQVGSPERVAESILSGTFVAVPRGRLGQDDVLVADT